MKRYLLAVIFVFSFVVSFSIDITLPNKDVKIVKDVLLYKGSSFTGNIIINDEEQNDGYSGIMSFKNGHLNGLTELKKDIENQHVKFTVADGKFDGELIMKDIKQRTDIVLDIKNGAVVKYLADVQGAYKYDLSFVDNLANGTMEAQGQKFEFKDGIAKGPQGQELKLTLDPESGDMLMEALVNGKAVKKQTIPNILTPQYLETFIFRAITAANK